MPGKWYRKKTKRQLGLEFIDNALAQETDECIEWPYAKTRAGYPIIWEWRFGKTVSDYVHRIVCRLAYGPASSDLHEAAHSCHNPACINKRHLSWQTHQQNTSDWYTNPKTKNQDMSKRRWK